MAMLNVAIAEDNPKTMELLNDMLKNEWYANMQGLMYMQWNSW